MKTLSGLTFSLLFAASLSRGASLPGTSVRGVYIEARNADVYTGACFANSEVGIVGDLAVFGWKIEKGAWDGVKLDGLGVVGVVRAQSTLGDPNTDAYPVKSVLIIDDRASMEQRLALKSFAERMGGDLLQDVIRVDYQPIDLTIKDGNIHEAEALLTAGSLAKIETRALEEGDQICHHEVVWYKPLTHLDHAMPAFTLANDFQGQGLDAVWKSPGERSAFVGTFHYEE